MNITKLLANKSNYTKGRTQSIKYIVIHYTANDGDTAKGNCNYFKGVNRNASAHYFVDENNIYQSVEDYDTAWHCGGSKYYHNKCRNNNSIGIELCSYINKNEKFDFKDRTVKNAVWLAKTLMEKYNIPIENVVRHYDVTHKICPAPFINNTEWNIFLNMIKMQNKENDEVVEKTKLNVNGKEYEVNRILKDDKNYVCLSDMKQAGFDVGYNEQTKVPSFGVSVNKQSMLINNVDKEVNTIMKNNENYVKLRDLEEFFDIDYDNVNKRIKLYSKNDKY